MSLPYSHCAMRPVVVPPAIAIAHAVRIADEEGAYSVLDTEVDDLPRGFMAQITDTPLGHSGRPCSSLAAASSSVENVSCSGLLFGELPELLAALTLEGADAAPGDDQRLARVGGDGGEVDFPQVNGRLDRPGSLFRLRDFEADVQLKATVPDQGAGSGVLRQGERQDERRTPSAHRQDDAPMLTRPPGRASERGRSAYRARGTSCASRDVPGAVCGGLDGAEEGAEDGLHRLAV